MQTLTALAVSSLILLPASPRGDALTWNPEEGSLLRRSVEISSESEVEEATLELMGNEQDVGSGMERKSLSSMVILDRFGKGRDGGPGAIQREYEGVNEESESSGAPDSVQVRESEGASGLLEG